MLVVATARVNSVSVTYLVEFLARGVQLCLNIRHLLFLSCVSVEFQVEAWMKVSC